MKWIGQHIWDFISRFRTTVYIENLETSSEENVLVVDSDGKITKNTTLGGADLTYNGSTANGVLTYGSSSTIDVESELTYEAGSLNIQNSSLSSFVTANTGDSTLGGGIILKNSRGGSDGQDGDILGTISFIGVDDGTPSTHVYGKIQGTIADATSGQEAGKLSFYVAEYDGTVTTTGLILDGDTDADGEIDVTIGAGAGSTTTVAGALNANTWGFLGGTANALITDDGDGTVTSESKLLADSTATSGTMLALDAGSLTSGQGVKITDATYERGSHLHFDITDTYTTNLNRSASAMVHIDYERPSGYPVASGQTVNTTAIDIFMDDNATNVGNAEKIGLNIKVDNASNGGTTNNYGIVTNVGGADNNYDIKMFNFADSSEYATLDVNVGGSLDIKTVSDDATGNIQIIADGNVTLDPGDTKSIELLMGGTEANNGPIKFINSEDETFADFGAESGGLTDFKLYEYGGGGTSSTFFKISIDQAAKTTISTTDNSGTAGDIIIDADGEIEMKSNENKISKTYDFQGTTFETTYSDDQASGTILKYSPGANDTLNGSEIYYLHSDQTWNQAQADAVANGASQLLGVGLGGSAQTVGVLLEGFVRIAFTEYLGTPVAGAPVYICDTVAGHFDFTAPTNSNEYVRIVGYCIDAHNPGTGNDILIYFKPDNTWVEIA